MADIVVRIEHREIQLADCSGQKTEVTRLRKSYGEARRSEERNSLVGAAFSRDLEISTA